MFPFNYFKNIWSPKKIFAQQHEFNPFQSGIILIFWSIVMLLPMVLNFSPIYDFDGTKSFSSGVNELPAETSQVLSEQEFENGAFVEGNESFTLQSGNATVSFIPPADDIGDLVNGQGYLLMLLPDSYSFRTPDGEGFGASYPFDFMENLESNESMMNSLLNSYHAGEISTQRTYYLVTRHLIFLVFGVGGIMMIAARLNVLRRRNFWDIYNFRNGLSMTAMASGLPSIIATLVGLVYSHNVLILVIQVLGTLLMLWISYRVTQFKYEQDPNLKEE